MYLSQEEFAEAILERFGMHESNPVATPIEKRRSLKEPINDALAADYPFRNAVGCLIYLMLSTRPDLAFSVGFLNKYPVTPEMQNT